MLAKIVRHLLVIGCAISASDGSSPQVYVRLLAVGHRLECDISSIASLRINSTQSSLTSTSKEDTEGEQSEKHVSTPLALDDAEEPCRCFAERPMGRDVVGPRSV